MNTYSILLVIPLVQRIIQSDSPIVSILNSPSRKPNNQPIITNNSATLTITSDHSGEKIKSTGFATRGEGVAGVWQVRGALRICQLILVFYTGDVSGKIVAVTSMICLYASLTCKTTYCIGSFSLWMLHWILQAPLLCRIIPRDYARVGSANVCFLLCFMKRPLDLLILDDITRTFRQ